MALQLRGFFSAPHFSLEADFADCAFLYAFLNSYSAYDIMTPDDDARHADHASVISARRQRGGRCEYFVRNSWGQDCSSYRPQFRARCERSRGGVWVTLEQLPTLYGVIDLPSTSPGSAAAAPWLQHGRPIDSIRIEGQALAA